MTVSIGDTDGYPRCYAAPDDGRPLDELLLSELRPWPAMDAIMMMDRICGPSK
jgi:hypothetical protein